MIRCIGLSDGGLRCCQVLRKYEVKGDVRKAVTAWVSYALRQGQFFKTTVVSSSCEGIERSFGLCPSVVSRARARVAGVSVVSRT